jgi:monomeric sarcosine oxidase
VTTIAVIGAGVFGAWTALRLAEDGFGVTLIDAYGAGNGRASSADHSRIIRASYGRDALYTRWATAARDDWRWLSASTGTDLLTTTGALVMGEPGNPYVSACLDTLRALDIAADLLEARELATRYPQIAVDGLGASVFERDAGVLQARAAVRATVALARERHKVAVVHKRVAPLDESTATPTVRADDGSSIAADGYVFACGPWLPQLFPNAIGGRVRPTRQEVLYFGVPPGDSRFSSPSLPVWIDFAAGVYGIPDVHGLGFKVGIDRHGPLVDPDSLDRIVAADVVRQTRDWMRTRFPALASAPLVDARVCQYENSSSGDFIIDRHPAWNNVWIAGGGSGHGFKHAPAIGRYVADLVTGRATPEPRFLLAEKTTQRARSVY